MTILIAEDDDASRAILARWLGRFGHGVVAVEDGKALLSAAARSAPDLVFSDLGLPGMDGLTACTLLRRARPELRIVLMTGDPASAREARARGFEPVLDKPLDYAGLELVIRGGAGFSASS